MQYKRFAERISNLPPTITGVAMHMSSSARELVYSTANLGPGWMANVTPSSFKQKSLPA